MIIYSGDNGKVGEKMDANFENSLLFSSDDDEWTNGPPE